MRTHNDDIICLTSVAKSNAFHQVFRVQHLPHVSIGRLSWAALMNDHISANVTGRISTGISGLDDILGGGLTPQRVYLVEGSPGAGKTTLGLQFLLDGLARGEAGLYVTLSETADELVAVGQSHGWDLGALSIYELAGEDDLEGRMTHYS